MGERFVTGSGHIIESTGRGTYQFLKKPGVDLTWSQVKGIAKQNAMGKIEEAGANQFNRHFSEMMREHSNNKPN